MVAPIRSRPPTGAGFARDEIGLLQPTLLAVAQETVRWATGYAYGKGRVPQPFGRRTASRDHKDQPIDSERGKPSGLLQLAAFDGALAGAVALSPQAAAALGALGLAEAPPCQQYRSCWGYRWL